MRSLNSRIIIIKKIMALKNKDGCQMKKEKQPIIFICALIVCYFNGSVRVYRFKLHIKVRVRHLFIRFYLYITSVYIYIFICFNAFVRVFRI